MGMFDYVEYEAPCRGCGKIIDRFQSKDGECTLSTLKPEEVGKFYGVCENCKMWNEYRVEKQVTRIVPVVYSEEDNQ